MSLKPRRKSASKRRGTRRKKMTLPDSEHMIAGKTRSETLSMTNIQRHRWYKTISPEEKKKAIKMVDIAGRAKISETMTERMKDPENRNKIRVAAIEQWKDLEFRDSRTGENHPMYGRTGKNNPMYGKTRPQWSETMTEKWEDPEFRDSRTGENHPQYGTTRSEKTKAALKDAWTPERKIEQGVRQTGVNNPNWRGGISFEPYCPAFDNRTREHIRNLYNRTCTVCGKSTLQNITKDGKWLGRLDVDHLDENKMQGCDDWEWRLAPLCSSCHGKMQKQERHLLLQLLLLKNKRGEIDFGEMNDD